MRGDRRVLGMIIVSSLALKLALLVPAHHIVPINDSMEYFLIGRNLARSGALEPRYRPPLYPAALGAVFWTAERAGIPTPDLRALRRGPWPGVTGLDVARFIQVLWSTLTVWLVYLLGRSLFDSRAGLVAAGIFAFEPNFVGFTALLWSETLFVLLTVGWVLLLVRGVRASRLGVLACAGALIGLSALTREIALHLLLLAVAWVWLDRPRPWRRALLMSATIVLGAVLVIAPWAIRNAVRYRAFVPITPVSGIALLWGVTADPVLELRRQRVMWRPPMEGSRLARERALEIVRADPGAYVHRLIFSNFPSLWNMGFDGVIMHLSAPYGFPHLAPGATRAVIVAVVGSYLVLVPLALVGLALARDWRATMLFVGMGAIYCVLHTIVGGLPRHRLPLMAFAALYAGFFVSRHADELRALASRRRLAIAMASIAFFAVVLTGTETRGLANAWRRAGQSRAP